MVWKGVLRHLDLRRLVWAQTASAFGDWLATVAFIALVYEITGSPAAVGVVLALRMVPALLAGGLVARAVNVLGPRRMMLGMDALRAGVAVVLPLIHALWWVYLWAVVLELAGLLFVPARDASIRGLVEDEELAAADGLVLATSYGTLPVGAGAFAAISAAAASFALLPGDRFAVAFWVDAVTFLVSFVYISRIGRFREVAAARKGEHVRLRDALRIPLVQAVLGPVTTVALGAGTLFSLGIVFVSDVLDAGEAEFGVLIILFGVGAAAGVALLQRRRPRNGMAALRVGVTLLGLVLGVMSFAPNVALAFLGAVVFGGAASYSIVAGMTELQLTLDDQERVLAFAAFHILTRVALVVGSVGAGVAAQIVEDTGVAGGHDPTRTILFAAGIIIVIGANGLRRGVAPATRPEAG